MMRNVLTIGAMLMVLAVPAQAETPTLSVSGVGEIAVAPDMARVSLGVIAEARTAAEALEEMSADLQSVLDGLAGKGIGQVDIQTSGLSVNPRYDSGFSSGGDQIGGYLASSQVTVMVRDLGLLGATLDAVVDVGANQMNGLAFDVADRAPHLDRARAAAVADAQAKAATYAAAAGLTLGAITSLREGGQDFGPQPMMDMAMSRSSVPVAEGEITISATVLIDYAIAD